VATQAYGVEDCWCDTSDVVANGLHGGCRRHKGGRHVQAVVMRIKERNA